MGKYQVYSSYRESALPWMGKVPSHWIEKKFKRAFVEKKKKPNNDLPAGSISFGEVIRKKEDNLSPETKASYQEVLEGEFLLNPLNLNFDLKSLRTALSEIDVVVSTGYIVLNGDPAFNQRYLRWLLFLFDVAHMKTLGSGVRQTINFPEIGSCEFFHPEHLEQTQIANFLDHETAKIDTLIEKQQQLIKLLKEKRQAVISHAVTKGLNPQAPMKDSGVEWLGEVPEHWAVMKFNHCAQIRNGLVDPKGTRYRDMVLYAPNHIEKASGKVLYRETASEQGADSNKYLCYQGEVIYSKIRPALAKVAICTEELALCSADMYPISCINGLTNEWLYWFMLSDSFTKAVVLDSDRVAMPKVNRESLGDYKIPFPTESEQSDISSHIKAQTQKLDVLEAKANHAIKLMQERRTALISAAVTGKIDVRNWQAPISQDQALEQTA
ncbi:restriction endonuclease subunit S [Vibrio fluvialis]|nr:restriction endonuclease subunit S [Vibrio fluvialis]